MGNDRPRGHKEIPLNWESLSEAHQALVMLAPSNVHFRETHRGNVMVEGHHAGKNRWNKEYSGTSTRWMSPWDHDVAEWAAAIAQVSELPETKL